MNPLIVIAGVVGIATLISKAFSIQTGQNSKPRIFISHSWDRGDAEYGKLISKLDGSDIEYYNHSIPQDKALDVRGKNKLREAFVKKIRGCHKVFIMANSGISSNGYVAMEVEIAKELNKEIIAVRPIGQHGIPQFIRRAAHKVVGNKVDSIIKTLDE